MTFSEILRAILIALAVFAPCLLASGALAIFATRTIADPRSRRRQRIFLGVWCVLASGAMAAHFLAYLGIVSAEATLLRVRKTVVSPLLAYLLLLIAVGQINRRIEDDATRLKLRKAVIYSLVVLVAAWLANAWLIKEDIDYGTFLGVVGAGLALSLHQVLLCLLGWLMLQINRYYDVGDRVQIGEIKGDVSDIGVLHTTLVEIGNWVPADQSTGRLVTIPNSSVFTQPVSNYTRGFEFIWNEVPVVVTFESNWQKAQEIMLNLVREGAERIHERFRQQVQRMARRYMIPFRDVEPVVHVQILDSGVELTLRYLTEPRRRRHVVTDLAGKILDAFEAESDIELAYPTTRFYDASREGSPKDIQSSPQSEGGKDGDGP
jgi:small-conductance mechanosensitive channel